MFTGIVEEIGVLKQVRKGTNSCVLTLQGRAIFDDLRLGDSVAVNGVCLTASKIFSNTFQADVMHESLNRSTLGNLTPGAPVNLERAMAANGRFGGHMVSGHIDGVGRVKSIKKDDNAVWFTIAAERKIMRYLVEKGSIAVDGISLTVASVGETEFRISAIPHTVKSTVLSHKLAGDPVNLENDLVGKYVEKLFFPANVQENSKHSSGITNEFLTKFGY